MGIAGDEGIPVNKRGSGVRRLILLNFFRAKVDHRLEEKKNDCDTGSVIYVIEEPETYKRRAKNLDGLYSISNPSSREYEKCTLYARTVVGFD